MKTRVHLSPDSWNDLLLEFNKKWGYKNGIPTDDQPKEFLAAQRRFLKNQKIELDIEANKDGTLEFFIILP